jgi:hypothetical protein
MAIKKTIKRGVSFVKNSLVDGKKQVGTSLRAQDKMMNRTPKATVGQAILDPVRTGMAFGYGATKRIRRKLK